eukprot:3282133-Prorocentrum_lima.AAC.1
MPDFGAADNDTVMANQEACSMPAASAAAPEEQAAPRPQGGVQASPTGSPIAAEPPAASAVEDTSTSRG